MPKRTKQHANRNAQIPDAFRKYLHRLLPGFKRQPDHVQVALSSMILQSTAKYREHSLYEGWATFSYKSLDEKFGRGKFQHINQLLGIFITAPDWSKVEGRTKPYKLTDKVEQLRQDFLAGVSRRITDLLSDDGAIMRSAPKQAIEAKRTTKSGLLVTRSGWHGRPVEASVPVNQMMLKKLTLVIDAKLRANEYGFQPDLLHPEPDNGYLKELLNEVRLVHQLSRNSVVPGRVIHRYAQTESGRLYASGVNLQNAYRPVRQAALHGLYDYDIENCHYSIMDQMAAKHGHTCTAIKHYLSNKGPVRRSLAAKFGISIKQVKQALLALVYGASFSEKPKDALPKILGSVELAIAFYDNHLFQGLWLDIRKARAAILRGQVIYRGENIKNLRGLSMSRRGHADRQILAHLLQGVESVALEAAHELYGEKIVLLQHDGFTATSNQLDTKAIEQAILQATGYLLKVEKPEQILVTLDGAFGDHPEVSFPNQKALKPAPVLGSSQSHVS